jgi:hypothetical protein
MAQKPGLAVKIAVGRTKPGADLGSPSDFGAPAKPPMRSRATPPPPTAAPDLDPDQDGDIDSSPSIAPEAVNYHDDEQRCELCQYFGDSGDCAVLKMPVQAAGGCNAFSATQDQDTGDMSDTDQDDDGTSLAPAGGSMPPRGGSMPPRGGYGS